MRKLSAQVPKCWPSDLMQSHMNIQVPVWPRAFWHGFAPITEKELYLFFKQSATIMLFLLTNADRVTRNTFTERNNLTMIGHLLPWRNQEIWNNLGLLALI